MTADTTTLPPLPPSIEAAHAMGATGSPAIEGERLAFEAWMRGHCWHVSAEWTGSGYRGSSESAGNVCPHAMMTRRLWAAWRDRAALAQSAQAPAQPAPSVDALTDAIEAARQAAHAAVSHVGASNYAHREQEAHKWVNEAFAAVEALARGAR